MKARIKAFLIGLAVCVTACAAFIISGRLYLKRALKPAENSVSSEPYYSYVPESCGVMFDLCGDRTLVYLDFEESSLTVAAADGIEGNEIYGYSADYTVKSDYSLVGGITDILGGINLESENGILSLTGSQVEEQLSTTADGGELRRTVTEKIIEKIAQNGLAREDFSYIIENSEATLTVPDCFYWCDFIGDICKNVRLLGY